jgi:hypothetical protein
MASNGAKHRYCHYKQLGHYRPSSAEGHPNLVHTYTLLVTAAERRRRLGALAHSFRTSFGKTGPRVALEVKA